MQNKESNLKATLDLYRGLILDYLEQELLDLQKWPYIRSTILRLLSKERGLEFKLTSILKEVKNG